MKITFDPAKRDWTLRERNLDFAQAVEVFAGPTLDAADDRYDYGELRMVTIGYLRGRMVVVCWTPRGDARHVFSMRKANEREKAKYSGKLPTDRQRHEEDR
jgi:uncharacterized protein